MPLRGLQLPMRADGNRHFYSSKVIDQALAMHSEGASVASIGGAMEINEGAGAPLG